jgi:hypothetical protein
MSPRVLLRLALCSLLLGVAGGGCLCGDAPPADAGPTGAGVLIATVDGDTVTLRLESLAAPLRTLQVDVAVEGAQATALEPAGDRAHDVLDAALESPRADLTVVIADTRRLLLAGGEVALLRLDGSGTVVLENALAVDDDGQRVELRVDVR